MWELYDELISKIPVDITVKEFIIGAEYSLVITSLGGGIAKTVPGRRVPFLKKPVVGMPLKVLASSIKSFNYIESSLALAAINSYYNSEEILKFTSVDKMLFSRTLLPKHFFTEELLPLIRRESAALFGHFTYYEEQLPLNLEYLVLDETPEDGDFPLSATEYVLPSQKNVWIPGSALTKKQMPRLLEICSNPNLLLFDLDIPLSEELLKHNHGSIISLKITDLEQCIYHVKAGSALSHFLETGEMICLKTIT